MPSLPAPSRICTRSTPNSPKAVLQFLSKHVAEDLGRHPVGVADALSVNGGAGIVMTGSGVLIVDTYLPMLDEPYILLARLQNPVVFEPRAGGTVDLVVLLMTDDKDKQNHLRYMAALSRRLHDQNFLASWRAADHEDTVRILFTTPSLDRVAA